MCEVKIEKLDNQGRGICYVNNKITFVENALPEEQVIIRFTKESKKFNEAEVLEYIMTSKDRVESPCPYFKECGGCELLNLSYENTCKYKKEKLENILSKYANIKTKVEIVKCSNHLNYRNKITLKVENGKYGYYAS